jgi:hypothetical protein
MRRRCGIMVYPAHAKPYPCFQPTIVKSMCKTHALIAVKWLKKAGLLKRKVRSDKGIAKGMGDGG